MKLEQSIYLKETEPNKCNNSDYSYKQMSLTKVISKFYETLYFPLKPQ